MIQLPELLSMFFLFQLHLLLCIYSPQVRQVGELNYFAYSCVCNWPSSAGSEGHRFCGSLAKCCLG